MSPTTRRPLVASAGVLMSFNFLSASNTAIETTPRILSATRASGIFSKTVRTVLAKPDPDPPRMPSRAFSCDAPIIKAVAEVKPTVTGSEMRSTSAPSRKTAISSSTMPERKQSSIASCGPDAPPYPVCRLVISESSAVGPIVTSRQPPSRA
uniref:Putative secreted protein n=1 Tax=Anopheles triannulatus TaxID=58253 RepID=A0A2M4B3Q3_9DIPT